MTDYHNYQTPDKGKTDWHKPLNQNFENIDKDIEIRDKQDNKTNYEAKNGAKYLATDTGNRYIGDGNSWEPIPLRTREINDVYYPDPEDGIDGIQRIIDDIGEGVTIKLRPGQYVGKELELVDKTTIIGMGHLSGTANAQRAQLFLEDGADTDLVVQKDTSTPLTRPEFRYVSFVGNKANNSSGSCVRVKSFGERIMNCTFRDAPEHGYFQDTSINNNGTSDNSVHAFNRYLQNGKYGFNSRSPAHRYIGLLAGRNGWAGIHLSGTTNLLTGCQLYGNGEKANTKFKSSQIAVRGPKTNVLNCQIDAGISPNDDSENSPCISIQNCWGINLSHSYLLDQADSMLRLSDTLEHIYVHSNVFWSGKSTTADDSNYWLEYIRRSDSTITDVRIVNNAIRGNFNKGLIQLGDKANKLGEIWIENNYGIDNKTDLTALRWTPSEGTQGTHNGSGAGVQGPAHYINGEWVYENGTTESASADAPQGSYPVGQVVYFTDTSGGNATGTYIIDNIGNPQGPI
jgi:hypothetical protein